MKHWFQTPNWMNDQSLLSNIELADWSNKWCKGKKKRWKWDAEFCCCRTTPNARLQRWALKRRLQTCTCSITRIRYFCLQELCWSRAKHEYFEGVICIAGKPNRDDSESRWECIERTLQRSGRAKKTVDGEKETRMTRNTNRTCGHWWLIKMRVQCRASTHERRPLDPELTVA